MLLVSCHIVKYIVKNDLDEIVTVECGSMENISGTRLLYALSPSVHTYIDSTAYDYHPWYISLAKLIKPPSSLLPNTVADDASCSLFAP